MAEVPKILIEAKVPEENVKEMNIFIKKFVKLKAEKAVELKKSLQNLRMIKMKDEHIAQVISIMPEDSVDLNKIFVDSSLDEDETKKILEIVKEFK